MFIFIFFRDGNVFTPHQIVEEVAVPINDIQVDSGIGGWLQFHAACVKGLLSVVPEKLT